MDENCIFKQAQPNYMESTAITIGRYIHTTAWHILIRDRGSTLKAAFGIYKPWYIRNHWFLLELARPCPKATPNICGLHVPGRFQTWTQITSVYPIGHLGGGILCSPGTQGADEGAE